MSRNGGQWTEARWRQFVVGALRSAHRRWGPRNQAKKKAWVERGIYECAGCGTQGPPTLPPDDGKTRRKNNAVIDHIDPVIDPNIGFTNWDEYIERMFIEVDGYQILCKECHDNKTASERKIAAERKKNEREG